ncbi:MAG: 7-carboxy-7-deazaguanine synthase QueE [Flavobacteriales bacterium]|jgi:organic radical activating enzyme|nr:7-carboxy-7-deazaguanine synthase QueE [Flavobacteriales bacterium]
MEQFYTIQGEGFHSGRAAYFIRIAGCDVGCVWCDVKESWEVADDQKMDISELVKAVEESETPFVVITGGEPAMYDLSELTAALKKTGVEIAMETSGAYPIRGTFDWICLSPKKFKLPLEENFAKANEFKVIIFNKHDFKWAEELRTKLNPQCLLYLQTEWDKSEKMLPLIVDYVKGNTKWNISLQTHKYMDIP